MYTLRSGSPSFKHYNSRGDVVAKTDGAGAITYQAAYEAFGKHGDDPSTQEWGTNPDRQQANTKDEDPTGLLNERYRYRDLDTGTFLTRDPAGFVDGPNVYTYVRQNPWTRFDPLGLEWYNDWDDFKHAFAENVQIPAQRGFAWVLNKSGVFDGTNAQAKAGSVEQNLIVQAEVTQLVIEQSPQGSVNSSMRHTSNSMDAAAQGDYSLAALEATAATGDMTQATLELLPGVGKLIKRFKLMVGNVSELNQFNKLSNTGTTPAPTASKNTSSHSKQLGKNLETSGYPKPGGQGWQAGHIVPTNNFKNRSKEVQSAIQTAQEKFNKYLGEDQRNAAINGFWAQAGHAGTHTDKFFLELGDAFSNVSSSKQAEATLNKMWKRIEQGEFQ